MRLNLHIQSKLLQHTAVKGTHSNYQLGCLSRTLLEVREKEKGVVVTGPLKSRRYRDANLVPTSPLADDIATTPSEPIV